MHARLSTYTMYPFFAHRNPGAMKDMEQRAADATSTATIALNNADPTGEWTLEASVRAIDACRAAVIEAGVSGGGSGFIMYVKLTMTGSRGTVAVGDSYAVVPSSGGAKERRNAQQYKTSLQTEETTTLLLTGTTVVELHFSRIDFNKPPAIDSRVATVVVCRVKESRENIPTWYIRTYVSITKTRTCQESA